MGSKQRNRALHAVQKVRSLREEAAKRDLMRANEVMRLSETEVTGAHAQWQALDDLPMARTIGDLMSQQAVAASAAQSLRTAVNRYAETVASTHVVKQQWQDAKTELSAIENLIERRDEAWRAEQHRLDMKEADDLSTRHRGSALGSPSPGTDPASAVPGGRP